MKAADDLTRCLLDAAERGAGASRNDESRQVRAAQTARPN